MLINFMLCDRLLGQIIDGGFSANIEGTGVIKVRSHEDKHLFVQIIGTKEELVFTKLRINTVNDIGFHLDLLELEIDLDSRRSERSRFSEAILFSANMLFSHVPPDDGPLRMSLLLDDKEVSWFFIELDKQ